MDHREAEALDRYLTRDDCPPEYPCLGCRAEGADLDADSLCPGCSPRFRRTPTPEDAAWHATTSRAVESWRRYIAGPTAEDDTPGGDSPALLTRDPWASDAPRRDDEEGWNDTDTDDHDDTARDVSGADPASIADIPDEWPDEPDAD